MGRGWIDEGEKGFVRSCLAKVKRIRRAKKKKIMFRKGDCKVGTTRVVSFLRKIFLVLPVFSLYFESANSLAKFTVRRITAFL